MKKTPLDEVHRQMGGRMVAFAGWEMPVQYKSALKEHRAVRNGVGVFDVSHMGQIEIRGKDALVLAQRLTCNDLMRIEDQQAQYSAFLSPEGTFLDDIVVYRFNPEHIFICVNAATTGKDFKWVVENADGAVEIADNSDQYVQLAVQGPRAEEVLQKLTDDDLQQIRFYRFKVGKVAGVRTIISRTGYTGEDGFELYFHPESAEMVWRNLLESGKGAGITPAGLAARNTLRLEMRYPLYGNDIDETTTPPEAGLGWIVKLDKGEFIGRKALEKEKEKGLKRKLVGFQMIEKGIARDGQTVFLDDRLRAKVTSGGFSPSLEKSIGLCYLSPEEATIGRQLEIDIRGQRRRAEIVETPFYKPT